MADSIVTILCNGARFPVGLTHSGLVHSLEYRTWTSIPANIRIELPDFVRNVFHLPDRFLDLLEIAAYVYCADRKVKRGSTNSVEYHSWSRNLRFVIKVRDYDFWNQPNVSSSLSKALEFMTGDQSIRFLF